MVVIAFTRERPKLTDVRQISINDIYFKGKLLHGIFIVSSSLSATHAILGMNILLSRFYEVLCIAVPLFVLT